MYICIYRQPGKRGGWWENDPLIAPTSILEAPTFCRLKTRHAALPLGCLFSRVVSMGFSISYFFNIRHDEMLVAIPLTSGTQRTSGQGEREREKKKILFFSSDPLFAAAVRTGTCEGKPGGWFWVSDRPPIQWIFEHTTAVATVHYLAPAIA